MKNPEGKSLNVSEICIQQKVKALRDTGLFRQKAFINGKWVEGDGSVTDVFDPACGEKLGHVANLTVAQVSGAIDTAHEAFTNFRRLLPQERSALLMKWHDLIVEHTEELALMMTLEQGKTLDDGRGEVNYGAGFVSWFAEEARRMNGHTIASHLPGKHLMTVKEPVGVAALVTPWNFPLAMLTRKAAAALAAGCPVVAYPSNETPFTALALARLAEMAGFPEGVFNVLTGDAPTLVAELCRNTRVRAFSFTGSTEVGRLLNAQCAPTIKKVSMELGGHAPFIGFADVDIENLVKGAVDAKFATTGQDCLAASRIYIQREIYPSFVKRFASVVSEMKVGSGFEDGVKIGPLQHERQVLKSEEHVADALAKGARLLTGGKRHDRGGFFYEPTVLVDITPDMLIYTEETFGPVAAVLAFDDETEVLKAANATEYGLGSYVYTRDIERVWKCIDGLEYGMVAINSVKMTGDPVPFGGVKQSGLGREGSSQGMDEYTESKYICMGTLPL